MNSTKNIGANCYYCGKQGTSIEHVPPKCLFPEQKDILHIFKKDYRINLITVPSCEEHNIKKSGDDEYLLACLAGKLGNNSVAFVQNSTKVKRALHRNKKLIDIESSYKFEIDGIKFPIGRLKADNYRLVRSFESIAKGIYYHEFQNIYFGSFKIVSSIFTNTENKEWNRFNKSSIDLITKERRLWKTEIKGNNPDIFTYQFSPKDVFGIQTLALNFYEKIVVFMILDSLTEEEKKIALKLYKKSIRNILDPRNPTT